MGKYLLPNEKFLVMPWFKTNLEVMVKFFNKFLATNDIFKQSFEFSGFFLQAFILNVE